jgi:hypothetical protein
MMMCEHVLRREEIYVAEQDAVVEEQVGFPWRYFAIAFAWAWVFWAIPLATTRGWITNPTLSGLRVPLLAVGAYAPFVAAFWLTFRDGGRVAAWRFFKRAFRWKIPPMTLLVALFLSPALAALAVWVRSMQGGVPLAFQVRWNQVPVVLFFLFFLGGSFNEEFGWAYAIDRMLPRWGFVKGALLLGCVWACWHGPLFFMPTQSQSHMPFWTFLILCCSLRLLYVWAYDSARQSILVTLLFHTSVNFTLNLFALLDPAISPLRQATWMYYMALLVLSAVVVGVVSQRKKVANG